MSHKTKSSVYFASLVIALITYYNISEVDNAQNTELVENTIENTTAIEGL